MWTLGLTMWPKGGLKDNDIPLLFCFFFGTKDIPLDYLLPKEGYKK